MRFTDREVIVKNGYTFSIMKFNRFNKWNLVLEYSNALGGNRTFDTREECVEFIDDFIKG